MSEGARLGCVPSFFLLTEEVMTTEEARGVGAGASTVFVGFGSNLGDSRAIVQNALERLALTPQISSLQSSSFYVTAPVGFSTNQPAYLNGVVRFRTNLPPHDLLDRLQQIELELGRERKTFWGARTIDLDLLLYDAAVINDSRLIVPHPRMHWRLFVLDPMLELAPDVVIPTLRLTIRETRELLLWNQRFHSQFVRALNVCNAATVT